MSEAVPELVKANAPQPQATQRAAAAADADLDVGDHGPKWIASHGGEPQEVGETAAQAVAAGTHSAKYLTLALAIALALPSLP